MLSALAQYRAEVREVSGMGMIASMSFSGSSYKDLKIGLKRGYIKKGLYIKRAYI